MKSIQNLAIKYNTMKEDHDDFNANEYLVVKETQKGLIIHSKTECFSSLLYDLIDEIIKPQNSTNIKELHFLGIDSGPNGTNHWRIESLNEGKYPILDVFKVQLSDTDFTNSNIIEGEEAYVEGGVIASITKKMPLLQELEVPSAPNIDFFKYKNIINRLTIDIGYDKQNFLANLANSSTFNNLQFLLIGEMHSSTSTEPECKLTIKEIEYFMQSNIAKQIHWLQFKNLSFSEDEIKNLLKKNNLTPILMFSQKTQTFLK